MRILELNELDPLVQIDKKLNIEKIRNGEKNEYYYDKMEKWFIDDMSKLVRSPQGFTVDVDEYNLWLNGEDMIWFFILRFNKYTGAYLGPKTITIRRRLKGSKKVMNYEYKKFRTDELNMIIKRFVRKATELGYLI